MVRHGYAALLFPRVKPPIRLRRPALEILESRRLLSDVRWIAPTSGDWNTPADWSTGQTPGPGDNVAIDVPGVTVTVSSGTETVGSITSSDPLVISAGSLTVSSGASTFTGGLTMTGGSLTADGSGVSLTVSGTTSVTSASLYAQDGATLGLPGLSRYSNPEPAYPAYPGPTTFMASGTGSVLALPGLTAMGALSAKLSIQAQQGGQVLVPALSAIISSSAVAQITSSGANSVVDVSGLKTLDDGLTSPSVDSWYFDDSLSTLDSGTILDGSLQTLNGVNVTVDGASTLAAGQWTSFTNGSITLNGGAYNLSALANITGSSVVVSAGSLTLPAVTTYADVGLPYPAYLDVNVETTFQANGPGAVLSLPNLVSLGQMSGTLQIQADQGGRTLLPALESIDTYADIIDTVQITADGATSVVDLSGLRYFVNPFGSGSDEIFATNSGTILDGSLQTLSGVNVTLDGEPTMAVAQWTSFTNGSMTVNAGIYSLSELATITGSSFTVDGGELVLSAATSYSNPVYFPSTTFQATGSGSVLSFPNLTSLGSIGGKLVIDASQGGRTLLPDLTAIDIPEIVQIAASGVGSEIDLSALETFDLTAQPNSYNDPANTGLLSATESGAILDGSLQTLNNIEVTLDGSGAMAVAQWTSFTNGDMTVYGGDETLTSLAAIGGSSFDVYGGGNGSASLILPAVTTYSNSWNVNASSFLASGSGSVLSLPALTSLGSIANSLVIQAERGGQTLLPALTAIGSAVSSQDTVQITANGVNSVVDLSALKEFVSPSMTFNPYNSDELSAIGSGTILDASLQALNGVNVTLDGAPTMAVAQWTSFTNGSMTVNAGVYWLSELTTITGSSFDVNPAGSLTIWATSYSDPTGSASTDFQTIGSGAVLSFPLLTTLGSLNSAFSIQALQGGQTRLPALTAINTTLGGQGSVQVTSDGANSEVDLSGLTVFVGPSAGAGSSSLDGFFTGNSGAILDGSLQTLNGVDVTLDGAPTMAVAQWTSFTNGTLTVDAGVYWLSELTTITGSSFFVNSGSLTVWATSYSQDNGRSPNNNSIQGMFEANGPGAVLSMPYLSSLGAVAYGLDIFASLGGHTLLPALTAIDGTVVSPENVQVLADGANSVVDLSSLTTFVETPESLPEGFSIQGGEISVQRAGTILDASLQTLRYVDVTLDGTGIMAVAQWTSFTHGGFLVSGGATVLSGLTTITGSSFEVDGYGRPNANASLTLPAVTTFTSAAGTGEFSFQAYGAGAVLSLPNLTSLGSFTGDLSIQADNGGQTLFPALAAIESTRIAPWTVQISASGAGSVVDVSALTIFNDAGLPSISGAGTIVGALSATNSGTILDGALQTLNNVDVTLDQTATMAIAPWTSFTNGEFQAYGEVYSLSRLKTFTSSSFVVDSYGVAPSPPSSSINPTGSQGSTFQANGFGAVLSFPSLTSLASLEGDLVIEALNGGRTLLPALTAINTAPDSVQITVNDTGSEVDLSALTTFIGGPGSTLSVTSSGTILDPALTELAGLSVTIDSTAAIDASLWSSFTNGSLTVTGGWLELAGLTNVNGTSFVVNDAVLSMPGVTRYSSEIGPSSFTVQGLGGTLSMPYLTTVDLSPQGTPWDVNAIWGGQILLPSLSSVTTTAENQSGAHFSAVAAGSEINLSSLTTPPGTVASFTATYGGTILLPPPPPVALDSVRLIENKAQKVTEILLTFSGPLDPATADQVASYALSTPGKNGAFTAKSAGVIRLGSALYNGANVVALDPKNPFTLAKPVQLLIAGASKGATGGSVVEVLTKNTPHGVVRPPRVVKPARNKIPSPREVAHAAHDAAITGGERVARRLSPRIDLALASVHHDHRRG